MKPTATRRQFLVGCSSAIAALAGTRFGSLAFSQQGANAGETLVVVFLRGGIDGLSLVPPLSHGDRGIYEQERGRLAIPDGGENRALDIGSGFGLHPAAAPLHRLFQSGHLAVVQATGMLGTATRSHFDAMAYMELGTPGETSAARGWLARHLELAGTADGAIVPSLAAGNLQPTSLRGSFEILSVGQVDGFDLDEGPWRWRDAHRTALRRILRSGSTGLHDSSLQALNAADIVELATSSDYTPANGAEYPSGGFGRHLEAVARMIKADLGLSVATLDLGGWDTHTSQGNDGGGYFASRVGELARGLEAFLLDLDGAGSENRLARTTVVVQSEFGRRLRKNADDGTDHGHGNVTLVAGGTVHGGVHGAWPGLAAELLFDRADLAATTDYRTILSEILVRRFGNTGIGEVFPGFTATYAATGPLGIVRGADQPIR